MTNIFSRFFTKTKLDSAVASPHVTTECLLWTSAFNLTRNEKRPVFSYRGEAWYASRVIWTLVYGEISDGKCVLHKCDNSMCVNINHLFLGSQEENITDMLSKNRAKRGKGRPIGSNDSFQRVRRKKFAVMV